MHAPMHEHMHIQVCTHICIYNYTYMHTCTYTHECMNTHAVTCMHTHMHKRHNNYGDGEDPKNAKLVPRVDERRLKLKEGPSRVWAGPPVLRLTHPPVSFFV